jgi:hypothetical protein
MEARPYGLVIGCAALALLGWTYRDRWPRAGRIGYIAGILGAAAVHYYGFMIAMPFGAAALWSLWRKRRWDLWTILGCVCAILPNLWDFQLIHEGLALYKAGWWSPPSWSRLARFPYGWSLEVLAAVFAAYLLLRTGKKSWGIHVSPEEPPTPQSEEPGGEFLICWVGFSAMPILAMLVAKATSGMFVLRYSSMYTLGYGLLLAYLAAGWGKYSRLVGYAAGCAAVLAFACAAALTMRAFEAQRDNLLLQCADLTELLEPPQYRESHLLIGDQHLALQLSQYCDDIRNRIVYGADPARALFYTGSNADNKAMLGLRESPPMTIEPLDELLRRERHELVVFDSRSSILKAYLSDEPAYRGRLHLMQEGEGFTIYRLDPAAPAGTNHDGGK